MKVELTIADDRELRAAVRDLVKGEVRSIARGEIRAIIAEVVNEKALPKTEEELYVLVQKAVRDFVLAEIENSSLRRSTWIKAEARRVIVERVQAALKDPSLSINI